MRASTTRRYANISQTLASTEVVEFRV
jgi:hypothetical protein